MYKRSKLILLGGAFTIALGVNVCWIRASAQIQRYYFLAVHDKHYQLHSYRALRTLKEPPQLAEWNSSILTFPRFGWPFYLHINSCVSSGRICYYVISLALYKILLKFSFKCITSVCWLFEVQWLNMHKKFVLIPYVDRSKLWIYIKKQLCSMSVHKELS